ncbi:hypothetical protein MY9_2007 [Bacillus sp. JS]|nr:hypothetical protein MY9_2007 [Bacillus sp. JS]
MPSFFDKNRRCNMLLFITVYMKPFPILLILHIFLAYEE